jgi:hypothetical protein
VVSTVAPLLMVSVPVPLLPTTIGADPTEEAVACSFQSVPTPSTVTVPTPVLLLPISVWPVVLVKVAALETLIVPVPLSPT